VKIWQLNGKNLVAIESRWVLWWMKLIKTLWTLKKNHVGLVQTLKTMFLLCKLFSVPAWRSFTFLCSNFSSSQYFFCFLFRVFDRETSLYSSLKTGIFILGAVMYASSLSKVVLNFEKPGHHFWFRWLDWRTSDQTWVNWINSWETKKKSKHHWIWT